MKAIVNLIRYILRQCLLPDLLIKSYLIKKFLIAMEIESPPPLQKKTPCDPIHGPIVGQGLFC